MGLPPDPLRDPLPRQAVRDRQRRRHRPRRPGRGARGAARAQHRPLRPAHQRQRAPDHALPPDARLGGRGAARQAPDRHHAARDRPLLRRQGRAPGDPRAGPARREDPQEEDRARDGAQAALAAPVRQGARARPAVDDRRLPHLRPPHRAVHRRHRAADLGRARRRRRRDLRGRAGHDARHRPRHLSVRHLLQPGGRRGLHGHRRRAEGHRRGLGDRQGLRHARRRGPLPDRAPTTSSATRCARPAASTGRPRAARAASAGSTSSPCATPRA